MLTVKFVKSILPKKVRKYVCKDWCGDKKMVFINFEFWDITDEMEKESFDAFIKNNIGWFSPKGCSYHEYFLFRKGEK